MNNQKKQKPRKGNGKFIREAILFHVERKPNITQPMLISSVISYLHERAVNANKTSVLKQITALRTDNLLNVEMQYCYSIRGGE
jgi:hypothetical protein